MEYIHLLLSLTSNRFWRIYYSTRSLWCVVQEVLNTTTSIPSDAMLLLSAQIAALHLPIMLRSGLPQIMLARGSCIGKIIFLLQAFSSRFRTETSLKSHWLASGEVSPASSKCTKTLILNFALQWYGYCFCWRPRSYCAACSDTS